METKKHCENEVLLSTDVMVTLHAAPAQMVSFIGKRTKMLGKWHLKTAKFVEKIKMNLKLKNSRKMVK